MPADCEFPGPDDCQCRDLPRRGARRDAGAVAWLDCDGPRLPWDDAVGWRDRRVELHVDGPGRQLDCARIPGGDVGLGELCRHSFRHLEWEGADGEVGERVDVAESAL